MPGAAYGIPSPFLVTYRYAALAFGGAIAAITIPVPPGWVASLKGMMAVGTTLFAGATTNFGVVQVGDGTTVNKFGQMQLGVTATPFAVGAVQTVFGPPPIGGLTAAGSGTVNQSGLTGRNPANAPVAGVSGAWLFATSLTNMIVTFVVPSGAGNAGAADVILLVEYSDVG